VSLTWNPYLCLMHTLARPNYPAPVPVPLLDKCPMVISPHLRI